MVAFTPSHGRHRAGVAKKPVLASQSNSVAFRAVGARLTAALTHHDSALRGEAGCVPTRRRQRRHGRTPANIDLPRAPADVDSRKGPSRPVRKGEWCGMRRSRPRLGSAAGEVKLKQIWCHRHRAVTPRRRGRLSRRPRGASGRAAAPDTGRPGRTPRRRRSTPGRPPAAAAGCRSAPRL